MPLLLLPRGVAPAEVVDTPPAEDAGIGTQFPATSGAWRFSIEIAAAGDSPTWYDITQFYVGDRYQRGADEYKGKYRASLATVQLQIDLNQAADLGVTPDILAPWGQDTTDLFGVDIRLGAGLLMRASMVRVVAAVVVEWLPLWTGRVESWGDASFARGQTRVHEVSVVDTIADLANVPTIIDFAADDQVEYFDGIMTASSWQFGVDVYGDTVPGPFPIDLNAVAAITRMDQAADPLGLVWRSLRSGRLVIHPAPWDTISVARYDNPLLDVYPDGLKFSYTPDFTDIEYIADDDQQPFGISRTVAGILNSFAVTMPDDPDPPAVYAIDDPVSTGRYGIRPFTASWIFPNPPVVDDLLADRAYAESQALPLRTTVDHEGFWTALAIIDHLDPVTVVHATSDDGLVVTGTGVVRNIVEERTVRDDGLLNWQSTIQIDIDSTETSEPLLPVEDLLFVSSESPGTGGPASATFTWTNPTQPSITPTEVQYRVLGHSLIWTPKSYPGVGADGTTVNWLTPGTYYTFQVRLIRRVDGVVTNFSVWRQVRFFTPNRIWPIPTPGADPGDTDVIGDPPDDCDDFQIDLQENDGTGWVTVDTFTGAELTDNGDGTFRLTTPIPNSFFNDGSMYRFRSSCDGVDWLAGPEFDPPDDWTDPCPTPPALSNPPFNDPSLLVYVPKICTGAEDGDPTYVFQGMQIIEAVSGIPGVPGDALEAIVSGVGDPTERALLALADPAWSDTASILAYGECPQVVGATGDKSITIRVKIGAGNVVTCVLGECAGMRLVCTAVTSTTWRATAIVYKTGVTITLPTSTVLDDVTVYTIEATFTRATGDIAIRIDGTLDNTVGGTDNEPTVNALPIWRVGAPPESWVTDFALFDSVITAAPVGLPSNAVHWWDFNNAASRVDSGGAVSTITDLINGAVMTAVGPIPKVTTLGGNGLTAGSATPAGGGALDRMSTTGSLLTAQPIWASWVGSMSSGNGAVFFDLSSAGGNRPLAYRLDVGGWTIRAGTDVNGTGPDTSPHIFYAEFNGGSSKLYIDGVLASSGNAGAGVPNSGASMFNVYPGGNGGNAIKIGELVLGTGTHTGPEITTEYNRLLAKWI